MIVPVPEIGLIAPPLGAQNIFTKAPRALALIAANDSGGVAYAFSTRTIWLDVAADDAAGLGVGLGVAGLIAAFLAGMGMGVLVGEVTVEVADDDELIVSGCALAAICVLVTGFADIRYVARCTVYTRNPATSARIMI